MKSMNYHGVVILMLAGLLALPALAQNAAVPAGWPDPSEAHSLSMPSGAPPVQGYEAYLGPVNINSEQIIGGVPGYEWRHGCGPTAAGMVMGYYDLNGFDLLIPGDASTQTNDVDQAIATGNGAATHYSDYSLPLDGGSGDPIQPDLSELPLGDEHADDCIGDFMRTSFSVDGMRYGWSGFSRIRTAMDDYVDYVNTTYGAQYAATVSDEVWGDFTWDDLKGEIAANRPMVFLVDSDGDGGTDHFVTIVGWRDSNGYNEYACLDTWAPKSTVRWERFRQMDSSYSWGIYGATYFSIEDLNNPPVAVCQDITKNADAGCQATATISEFDGGCYDPDGDPITLELSFHGPYELGDTDVTLTVIDDRGGADSCIATITVVDVTPPDVTAPADIVIECTEPGGTPASDPQLTDFFATFTAVDNCDDDLDIFIDAPSFFAGPCDGDGVTNVSLTATDDAGNTSQIWTSVTVVDTTPPEIEVTVSPQVLWPPNHKMVDVEYIVTVSDICDDAPTWMLMGVTSNEPEDDLGDGTTEPDIMGVDAGTADTSVSLRAERQGGGFGRIYEATFEVTDCSGNTFETTANVYVPHSKSSVVPFASAPAQLAPLATDVSFMISGSSLWGKEIPAAEYEDYLGNRTVTFIEPLSAVITNTAGLVPTTDFFVEKVDDDEIPDVLVAFNRRSLMTLANESTEEDGTPVLVLEILAGSYMVIEMVNLQEIDLDLNLIVSKLRDGDDLDAGRGTDVVMARDTGIIAAAPNPFNPMTTVSFYVPDVGHVELAVFDISGRVVNRLVDQTVEAGEHSATWMGVDSRGSRVASGVYFFRMIAGDVVDTKRVMMVK